MAPARSGLPQAALDMLVLQAVAAGPMHGFGIMQRLDRLSAEVVRFPRASLYPALHGLEARRLIAWGLEPAQAGRDAKFYQVDPAGRTPLQGEAGRGAAVEGGRPPRNARPGDSDRVGHPLGAPAEDPSGRRLLRDPTSPARTARSSPRRADAGIAGRTGPRQYRDREWPVGLGGP